MRGRNHDGLNQNSKWLLCQVQHDVVWCFISRCSRKIFGAVFMGSFRKLVRKKKEALIPYLFVLKNLHHFFLHYKIRFYPPF